MAPKAIETLRWGARRFYRSRINPFACVRDTDLPFDEAAVNAGLRARGMVVQDYPIDIPSFRLWVDEARGRYPSTYSTGYGSYFEEKCLEHYLSLQFTALDARSVVIDVANAGSPFPLMASAMGATVYQNDLLFPEGTRRIGERIYEVGGNACALPLPDDFADLMVLHCAFEMFEGDQDRALLREASRVLKPKGVLVIVPLYLSGTHHILCDSGASRAGCRYDPGARIIYIRDFHGARFARFYDPAALKRRIADFTEGLKMTILHCSNAADINPDKSVLYLRYVGLFRKE